MQTACGGAPRRSGRLRPPSTMTTSPRSVLLDMEVTPSTVEVMHAKCETARPPRAPQDGPLLLALSDLAKVLPVPLPDREAKEARRTAILQMVILTLCGMAYQAGLGMCMPFYAQFAQQLDLGEGMGGFVIAAPCVARVALNLSIGSLVDDVGRKPLLIIGSAVLSVGAFCTAAASSLGGMLFGRLCVGVGGAASDIAAQAWRLDIVSHWPSSRGALLGWNQALVTLAYAAGPVIGGRLALHSGIRQPFFVFAYICGICAPLYALMPTAPSSSIPPTSSTVNVVCGLGGAHHGPLRAVLSDPRQRGLLLLRYALAAGWAAWMTVLPSIMASHFGVDSSEIGLMLSVMTLFGFVSSPLSGALADRLGHITVARAGALASACAFGLLPCAALPCFLLLLAVWEAGTAALGAGTSASAAELTRLELRGAQSSLVGQVQDATFVLVPSALGMLLARFGSEAALCVNTGMQLCAIAASATLTRRAALEARDLRDKHARGV